MAAIVRHPARVAATVSRAVRRSVLIGVIALCFTSAAQAAVLAHPGTAAHLRPAHLRGAAGATRARCVELDRVRGAAAAPALRRAGGRADRAVARALAPAELERAAPAAGPPAPRARPLRDARPADRDRPARRERLLRQFTDPLSPTEWWPSHIGVSDWTAPGPGVPVTMIDTGVDLTHQEFAGRPDTIALNTQTTDANQEELHGTATASVVGAPVNGIGIVGVYPQAKLQLWDASPTGQLTVGDEIAGLAAARRHGPGRDQPQPRRLRPAADRGARDPERLRRRLARRRLGRERPRGGQPAVVPRELRARADGRRDRRGRPRGGLLQRLAGDRPRRARAGHPGRGPDALRPERLRRRWTARASRRRSSPAPPPGSGRCGRR